MLLGGNLVIRRSSAFRTLHPIRNQHQPPRLHLHLPSSFPTRVNHNRLPKSIKMTNDDNPNPNPNPNPNQSSISRLASLTRQLLPSRPLITAAGSSSASSSSSSAEQDAEVQQVIGHLTIGPQVRIPITNPKQSDLNRLPANRLLLDLDDVAVLENLEWLGKKWSLGEDVFLLSPPSPYARRLALTFCAMLRLPYEYVSLHRDVGEAELLQTRSLLSGGSLRYEDGPVVRAMKEGRILIIEGTERAERNVMPLLNNILENREQNLADGTQLIPQERLAAARAEEASSEGHSRFVGVHPNFRVIAIGVPTPPYKGHALDPPFRSRFQARWVEGTLNPVIPSSVAAELENSPSSSASDQAVSSEHSNLSRELSTRFFEFSSLLRLHGNAAQGGEVLPPTSRLPNIPGTALTLLSDISRAFPPILPLSPRPEEGENLPSSLQSQAEKKLKEQSESGPKAFQGEGISSYSRPLNDPYERPPPQDGALQVANHVREKVSKSESLWYERIKKTPIASLVATSTRAMLSTSYPMMHLLDRKRGKLLAELLGALGLEKGVGINDREELLLSLPEGKEMEKDLRVRGAGLMGYKVCKIERLNDNEAKITFENTENGSQVSLKSPCGKLPFANLPALSSASESVSVSDQEGIEFDKDGKVPILITPRLMSMLSSMLQLHCLGRDICLLPSSFATGSGPNSSAASSSSSIAQSSASSSTSTCIALLASLLGYPLESVHLYKDISGQELIARRATSPDGSTTWESSPLLKGLLDLNGKMVHLNGIDTLGPTLASLSRLAQDRETELWGGRRATLSTTSSTNPTEEGCQNPNDYPPYSLLPISPSFRLIATSMSNVSQTSTGGIKADWLTEEASTLFGFISPSPMSEEEEMRVVRLHALCSASQTLSQTSSSNSSERPFQPQISEEEWSCLWDFARRYRTLGGDSSSNLQKSRRLGTRSLIRIASRMALSPTNSNGQGGTDLHGLLSRALLTEFLPLTTKELIRDLLAQSGIQKPGAEGAFQYRSPPFIADPEVQGNELVFVDRNALGDTKGNREASESRIPIFDADRLDPDGKDLIPTMNSFYNNPTQSLLMREIALDLERLNQHVLLMGNQGTGKNKVIDRILQLLNRPREYMQLHRDSTVAQILQLVQLEKGQLKYIDSPLVRGIKTGRIVVVDEADKCSAAVTAVFKSLAERGELTLPDGRRVRPPGSMGSKEDVIIHPSFRLVLLSNRPGFPFLGNSFLEVIGEGFSCFSVSNPDLHSEIRLLSQAAPKVPEELIKKLVLAVGDLRDAFDTQQVSYPYSLRELLHIVRHMNQFPEEDLTSVLLNVLSFDLHKPESMNFVVEILKKRGLPVKGLDLGSVREVAQEGSTKAKEALKVAYDPKKEGKSTDLDRPKEGKVDKDGKPHVGGNTWRGGTGGRDTAGMGGRGGFERLWDGNKVHQISDELKKDVPDHIKKQAREMAREALAKKLAEEGMTAHEGATYQAYKREMLPQTQHLLNVLNDLQANAKERSWLTRQQDGELDERRLTDGLAGERSIFKRRQEAPPEIGAPQTKPKRLRFVVDVSASMYAMQFDGRLEREIKTVVMIMEAMSRTDPQKYSWSIYGHSGDEEFIPFVKDGSPPTSDGKRWKVLKDMYAHTQFAGSGDNTLRGIEQAIRDITKVEGDDYFVIALSDAQMSRYGITSSMLNKSLSFSERVKTAVIFIDRGQEAQHIARQIPGKAHIARETRDLPQVLSSILTSMVS